MCVRREPFSHQPTAQGFRFQLRNRLGSQELENDQVHFGSLEFLCRCSEYLQSVGLGRLPVCLPAAVTHPPHLCPLPRCADQSERLSTAGRRAPRPLQHHFLCHPGRDPALPPYAGTGLPLSDAASPPSADRLLPKDHSQAGGRTSEI